MRVEGGFGSSPSPTRESFLFFFVVVVNGYNLCVEGLVGLGQFNSIHTPQTCTTYMYSMNKNKERTLYYLTLLFFFFCTMLIADYDYYYTESHLGKNLIIFC